MTLTDLVLQLSRHWCAAHDRSLSRLSTLVGNDGKLLGRLEEGKGFTVSMFERFLIFFRDSANWPDRIVPSEAAALLDKVGEVATEAEGASMAAPNSADVPHGSAGKSGDLTARAGPAVCSLCDLRAGDPAVAACIAPDCGLRAQELAA